MLSELPRPTSLRATAGAPPIVRLNEPKNLKISFQRFGAEKNPILVIDDVLANAEEIRRYAFGYQFQRPIQGRSYYPGFTAPCSLRGVDAVSSLAARIMWTDGFGRDPEQGVSVLSDLLTDTFFAIYSPAKTSTYGNVHSDSHSWLALLVYLTPGEESFSGTGFWRHKATGLESACSSKEPLGLMMQLDAMFKTRLVEGARKVHQHVPHKTYEEWVKSMFNDVAIPPPFPAHDHGPWENIGIVPAKFNRLVLYPTWQFHSIATTREKPSLTRDNVRLTLNTFVKHPALERVGATRLAPIDGIDVNRVAFRR
jgi:hypothetical protein